MLSNASVRVPDIRVPAAPFPARRLAVLGIAGLAAAALVLAGGALAERIVLGADDAAMRARVQAEVRGEFDGMALALRTLTAPVSDPNLLAAAATEDGAARRLFDAAEAALAQRPGEDLALTLYAADGQPVAWAGRPSELTPSQLQGPETWDLVQGALGLRLLYLRPLTASGARVGVAVAEHVVTPSTAGDPLVYATRFTRVSLLVDGGAAEDVGDVFTVPAPSGPALGAARLSPADLAAARDRWRTAVRSLAVTVLALLLILWCGPLIDWRKQARAATPFTIALLLTAAAVLGARALMRAASPADWSPAGIFSAAGYASPRLAPLLTSPFDLLLTSLALGALVALAFFGVEGWRISRRRQRLGLTGGGRRATYAAGQLAAGAVVAAALAGHFAFLRDTISNASIDLLHFSLHPWDTPRVALQLGLVVWHAAVLGLCVLALRAALVPWRISRHDPRALGLTALCWAAPATAWLLVNRTRAEEQAPLLLGLAGAVLLGLLGTRLKARYRHGSQAFRLMLLTLGLVVPALVFYPAVFRLAVDAKVQLVESRYAPQALNQRATIQQLLTDSLRQIDAFPALNGLVAGDAAPADSDALTDRAFQVWQVTGLSDYPITSSVELYGRDGRLVSRYAFNLPDDLSAVPRSEESNCDWVLFEEVSPFFAEERRVLHAARALCAGGGPPSGSIVVHAILDYENLPFIASRAPYVELVRPAAEGGDEGIPGEDVEYVVYGWSRTPLFTSGSTAWELSDPVFERLAGSRDPFWATLRRGGNPFDVYLMNDRFGIYALGFPVVSPLGHLMNLAELTVLAAGAYVLLVALGTLFGALSRRGTSARALLREVRASFYRKLFLAFVAAAVVPVVTLAVLTRNYVAAQMDAAVEEEAVRTATAARRVVEDLVAPRAAQQGAAVDDNLMVWVSRLIDQDVNIFRGPRLQATSERNLFASGLLPRRTPAPVYRGLLLRNDAATVHREQIGALEYLVAGTPVRARQIDAILTVPLTSRQQQIERQIDLLNRQVLLGALLFILAGAALGYSLAERIADPVNRLTRATKRIARGELDVRIAATSSDELRRLVQDFNSMASELERQRRQLERTHRLEAWAEMSRQVAHDIKNPLTPIQLNAEHLRRVHADRGAPLTPVLEECVGNILTQVRLLRQIASEFSNFASQPIARPAPVSCTDLLHDIVDPYVTGLSGRIAFTIAIPDSLPTVFVDRSLVARALTNIVENALYAMPGTGALAVTAAAEPGKVRLRVSDTGPGMDQEALARAFEPYFSTKATGTGLGLAIAKRNIELNGGEIGITTAPTGTTVEVTLRTTAS